jgi:hypothetical protein
MRINTALAALAATLLLTASVLQVPAFAESEARAQLRLIIVDETNSPLPAALVTIYSVDGNPGRDVTADDKGVVVVPSLPVGFAQIHARFPDHAPYIEATRLKSGENVMKLMLPSRGTTASEFSGS